MYTAPLVRNFRSTAVIAFCKTKCYAAIELSRPVNCLITFASVLLGGWLGVRDVTEPLLWAALSAALIAGGGNALNDLCGVAEDRINKLHRPLPSGRLSPAFARMEMGVLLIAGLSLAFSLPTPALAIAVVAIASLIFYNVYLKRVPLIGNLVVSALGGLAFLYGGAAVHALSVPWLIAGFAFLFHLGRELLKDLEDRAGDRRLQGGTVPISWGKNRARALVTSTFTVLIVTTPLPALMGVYGSVYLSLIVLLNFLILFVLIRLWQNNTALGFLSTLLKAGMLLGLTAFLFA